MSKKVRIGKFNVQLYASPTTRGTFCGTATFTWEEGDSTMEQQVCYDLELATEDEAIEHAFKKASLRIQNDAV